MPFISQPLNPGPGLFQVNRGKHLNLCMIHLITGSVRRTGGEWNCMPGSIPTGSVWIHWIVLPEAILPYSIPNGVLLMGEEIIFHQVWEFVTSVVVDVVTRYDIDAVHFDDYFYPYGIAGEPLPDSIEFQMFGGDYYPDRMDAWRRHNVDTIILVLHEAIVSAKPWVKFGISPFGVWRNRSDDPMGSETAAGTTNYDGLYADVILWQREGWIDYLMPQLYWRDDHPAADFSTLAYWWNDFGYGRSVYVGLAPYRISKKSEHRQWRKEKNLLQQIDLVRTLEGLDGFGFFSSRHFFRKELARLNHKIQKHHCSGPAVVPSMPWIDDEEPGAPFDLRREGDSLIWEVEEVTEELDRPSFFVLYMYDFDDNRFLKTAGNMVQVTGEQSVRFTGGINPGIYRVSSLDRLNNESQLSPPLEVH